MSGPLDPNGLLSPAQLADEEKRALDALAFGTDAFVTALKEETMNPFTVLLLYPDYIATTFGQETYLAHVEALDPGAAVAVAQAQADDALNEDDCDRVDDLNDFFPLAVFAGHLNDLNQHR